MHAREAEAGRRRECALQRLGAERLVRWRHDVVHEARGGIDEHAGGPTVRAEDLSAVRLPVAREVARDATQRRGVGPTGVTVHALEPHGPVRKGRVEVGRRREGFLRPVVLVPAAAEQPRAFRQLRGEGLEARDDFRLAARADEIGAHERVTESHQVGVGVDQARHDSGTACVVHRRARDFRHDFVPAAYGDEATVRVPGEGLGDRPAVGQRVDAGIDEDAATGCLNGGRGRAGEQQVGEHGDKSGFGAAHGRRIVCARAALLRASVNHEILSKPTRRLPHPAGGPP